MRLDPEERIFNPIMPEIVQSVVRRSTTSPKTAIIARSQAGVPVMCFENEDQARDWKKSRPDHSIVFFLQTITEKEIQLET